MKSASRVAAFYREGTKDWEAQFHMLLDDGVTCADCRHFRRCSTIFGSKASDESCQFYPNRFQVGSARIAALKASE